ncbi:ABC transporter permease [Helicobacter monodelphidis]|uniref:MlaE family ABC transporter permease n=1 Tax=Helicobacter sp. 15-1451 TaxID=2004995 RepID=UPI000DCD334D|nr:ABC transporter permease [Helicobacter sp. 15-1451]RAX58599.1 ABC transporter permease [Helicobacter sp. 15-1451]
MKWIEAFFSFFGRPIVALFSIFKFLGNFVLFHVHLIPSYFSRPFRFREILIQIETIGLGSFSIIALSSIFTGMVLAIQFYQGFHRFGAEEFMSYPIFLAITRELGPVFASLMLVSRAISAMAAELGTMRVNEQIDAIDLLGIDSKKFLIVPRILATSISLPLLVIIFDFLGNISAFCISTFVLDVNPIQYQSMIAQFLSFGDLFTSILKGFIFGILVSLIGSYIGFHTKGGAKGVGKSTTQAVVFSAITIFGANYLLSAFFLAVNW